MSDFIVDNRGLFYTSIVAFLTGTAAVSLYIAGTMPIVVVALVLALIWGVFVLYQTKYAIISALFITIGIVLPLLRPEFTLPSPDPLTGILLLFFFVFRLSGQPHDNTPK